jgi:hypothetical protein
MGWVVRPSGKRYYYRSVRVGRKTYHPYVGTGPHAEREAALDVLSRAQRKVARAANKAELERLKQLDQQQCFFVELADLLAKMHLTLAGYHQHDRSIWTMRRVFTKHAGLASTRSDQVHTFKEDSNDGHANNALDH